MHTRATDDNYQMKLADEESISQSVSPFIVVMVTMQQWKAAIGCFNMHVYMCICNKRFQTL